MRLLGILLAVLPPCAEVPVDGLTLDAAIERLVQCNYKLRARFEDISEARADELTASLRNAPALFLDGHQLPYGRYSEQRPGAAEYEVSPALNVDYSGKRRSRMTQTRLATRQIEARYQNAVRQEIGRLYEAHVDVLEARGKLQAAQEHLGVATEIANLARQKAVQAPASEADAARASLRRFKAATERDDAAGQVLQAQRSLAALLALPPEKADCLQVRDTLRRPTPALACADELIRVALDSRPDLAAERLGIDYNRASVRLTQAELFDDAIAFYSPFEAEDNTPQGKRVSTGWGTGAGTTLPLYDRNQGDIARARLNVLQTRIERDGVERRVINEVQRTRTELESSGEVVKHLEGESLPLLRRLRDENWQSYAAGRAKLDEILGAQKDFNQELQRYVEALARHRRAMLRINVVVGQRIVP